MNAITTTRSALKIATLSALCLMMLAPVASAAPNGVAGEAGIAATSAPPRARQVRQNARIRQGVRTGEVTRGERRVLKAEQRKINRTRKRFKANDGKIGRAERAKLNRMQNRSSRHIKRAKHNGRTR